LGDEKRRKRGQRDDLFFAASAVEAAVPTVRLVAAGAEARGGKLPRHDREF
jgi:hypothetical protein